MAENEANNSTPKKRKCIKYEQMFKAEYRDEFKFNKIGIIRVASAAQ